MKVHTIRFDGGALHGIQMSDVDSRRLTLNLAAQTGRWFKKGESGNVEIVDGANGTADTLRFDKNWLAIETHIYARGEKDECGAFVYAYLRTEVVGRCRQVTLSGARCMHPVHKSPYVCKTHKGQITSGPIDERWE